jgi:surface antigen
MKKLSLQKLSLLFTSILFISCTANKQGVGTGAGLLVGGLLGSQFGKGSGKVAATILGAGAGAFIGGAIGQDLDDHDKALMEKNAQNTLEKAHTNQTVAWQNPDNSNRGNFTPTKTYQEQGRYCREYTQTVVVANKEQKAYGKACRMPDGNWSIISN